LQREKWVIGLLYIDLDGFKLVNDSLGHSVGDLLLCEVAKRLQSRVRLSDTLARVGGDEFTVILTGLEAENDATVVANALIQSLSQPFVIEGNEISVGASIGISTRRSSVSEDPDLLKQADSAMYAAKRSGRNRAVHFSPELGLMARERLTLESELRGAIGRGEIYVSYQPEFSITSGRLVRFEALARWRHPNLGEISPATFIPVAEESGLIYALGEFVLEQACRECLEWQKTSPDAIQVAVNVSALQFTSEMIVEEVATILKRTGLKPELLQLELTESVMIGSHNSSAEKMMRLCSLGITLAIDDFGTGYSSLGYLRGLPFSALKIDRMFVRNLKSSSEVSTMLRSMIDLGKKMDMRVIVEGIEEASQLEAVMEMGADEVQGYLLGRPSPTPRVSYLEHLDGRRRSFDGKLSALMGS
jgi:diguanylate cyclase (GGDEF)-like protein